MISGLINVVKPPQMTSHDVVSWMRRHFGIKKIGHSGTLDPMATGVINIFIGDATKLIEYQHHPIKKYRAKMLLGYTSDTLDIWGKVSKEIMNNKYCDEDIKKAVKSFIGEINQIPPMYSAIKINGQKMYQLARKGQVVKREPRTVIIHNIKIINIVENSITLDITCSRGTYIRTLIDDIGAKLNTRAVMTDLIRIENEGYNLKEAMTLEEINKYILNDDYSFIIKMVDILSNINEELILSSEEMKLFKNGITPYLKIKSELCILKYNNLLVGLAGNKDGKICIYKRFLSEV